MQAELKQTWLTALRSGLYEQGDSQLVILPDDDNKRECKAYCCLGLLAEVAGLKPERFPSHAYLGEEALNNNECGLGPWERRGDPAFNSHDETTHTTLQRKLAGMNDSGKTFAQIADWIEAHIPAESKD